jgi:hypothetical protein
VDKPSMVDPRPNSYIDELQAVANFSINYKDSPILLGSAGRVERAFQLRWDYVYRWCAGELRRRFAKVLMMRWKISAAFLLSGFGCYTEPSPPQRPKTVPADAVWAGGPDGGRFIRCDILAEANDCVVHNDSTGDVEMSGKFVLSDTRKPATREELRYDGSPDGERIFLKGGGYLKKLENARSSLF